MDVSERFWSKVRKTDGCWLWTTGRFGSGYGQFSFKGRPVLAHRWAYEDANGPIPTGLPLDHTCHNQDPTCPGGSTCLHRRCVRPEHLEPTSLRTNTLRSTHTFAGINARKTTCPLGHPLTKTNRQGGRYCAECLRKQDREARMRKRREAGIPAGRGIREKLKTHCPRGHEYTPENTYVTTAGGRACRTCERQRVRPKR